MKVGSHVTSSYGDIVSVTPAVDIPINIVNERLDRLLTQGKVMSVGNKRWVLFRPTGPAERFEGGGFGWEDPLFGRRVFGVRQQWDAVYAGRWPQ